MYMGERGTISHFPRGGFYDSSRKVPKAKCEMVPLSFFGGADAAIYKTLLFWRREFVAIYSTLLVLKGEFVAIYSTLMTLMFEARSICCYLQHFALLEAIMCCYLQHFTFPAWRIFWRREVVAIYNTLLFLKGEFVAIYII